MKKISVVALLAALCLTTPVFAQTVTGGVSTTVNVATGNGGVSANAGANASPAITAPSVDANANGSTMAAANTPAGASSSQPMQTADDGGSCADIQANGTTTSMVDAAALAAVKSVTVFETSTCTGLSDLSTINASSSSALTGDARVVAAIQSAGYSGAQIVGYHLGADSLTVYVKKG